MAREFQEGSDRGTSRQVEPAGAPAPGKATLVDSEAEEIGELTAQRVGAEPDEDGGGPDVPVRDPEAGKQDLAAVGEQLPPQGGAEELAGGVTTDAPAGGGGGGEPSAEMTASIGQAQSETREAVAASEAEAETYKATMGAQRERFESEQHATMLEQLKTMSSTEKRQTLQEMGYDPKQVKKLKDAELDGIIEGKLDTEQRKTKILGMDPEERKALSPERKIQYLVDLGIDRGDLDKAGPAKATRLFDDVMAVAHVPGQHKVKIQIKGGLFGKSWEVSVKCDAEGNSDITAEKKGGLFSKLWGWIKAALPIILTVLGPLTAGASLVVLAVYQTVTAIKNGDWLGAIVGAAGALVGVGAFMAAKGALGAASTFSKIASVAAKAKNVAEAAKTAMLAAKAKNAGSLLGALAAGGAAFASFATNAADKFAQTMTRWSDKLRKWSTIISGGERVAQGIKHGDPLAAIGGAFDTAAAAIGGNGAAAKNLQRASTITTFTAAGKRALQSSPPNYGFVAEAALGIAGTLKDDRRLEDATRIVAAANRLKTAWDQRETNPAGLAQAAFAVAESIQIAKYDHDHGGKPDPDGKVEADRDSIMERYQRTGRIVSAAAAAVNAVKTKPRPNYVAALDAGTQLIAELTTNKRLDQAAQLTSALQAWTTAVNARDEAGIMAAGMAFGEGINELRASIQADRAAAKQAAAGVLPAGETLPDDDAAIPGLTRDPATMDPKEKDALYKTKEWAQRGFEQLDSSQRAMLDGVAKEGDGAALWAELPAVQRAGFLNITAALRANGFGTSGLKLLPLTGKDPGIQQDRLLFTADSGGALRGTLESAIRNRDSLGDRGFSNDKPEEHLHPGMAAWGGRQWVTRNSMQIGGGPAGVFVDIDEFGVKVDVVGTLGHAFEVLRNKAGGGKKTDPFKIGEGLHKRGDDP
jgi:hypothetical protein